MNSHTQNKDAHDNHVDSDNAHMNHQENKEITIFINTRKFSFIQKILTYLELVDLTYPGDIPSPDKIYEITYSSDQGLDGKVGVGGNLKLEEGMVINVCITNRS